MSLPVSLPVSVPVSLPGLETGTETGGVMGAKVLVGAAFRGGGKDSDSWCRFDNSRSATFRGAAGRAMSGTSSLAS